MQTTTLIDQLTKHLPANFQSEKQEDCHLLYIGDITIELKSDETHFLFSSDLGPVPPHAEKETFFQWIAGANFLRQGTGNAYINVKPQEQTLHLKLATDTHTPAETVQEQLEEFCNYIEYWKKAIRDYK